jgi:hypothetical protein
LKGVLVKELPRRQGVGPAAEYDVVAQEIPK